MSESGKAPARKTLLQQVLDGMFEALEQSDVFDAEATEGLRDLATRNRLNRAAEVEKALRAMPRRNR
jgi:hypothetical protein